VIKLYIRIALLVLIVVVLSSCKTTKDAASVEAPVNPLLVGVTPNYPPLIFKRGGAVVGKRGGEGARKVRQICSTGLGCADTGITEW
jgi:hypothetical protein